LVAVSLSIIACSFVNYEATLATVGIILFISSGIVAVLQLVVASRARCPLCLTQPVAMRKCAVNRSAKTLLASHRLHVAVSIILRNRFRCPYCGETTVIVSRR
jgi:hypothetical protein